MATTAGPLPSVSWKLPETTFLPIKAHTSHIEIKATEVHNSTTTVSSHNRWRPRFHLLPSNGWINDPCAPNYNPISKLYHLSFQWNPHQTDWGNISWGSAVSEDLISWHVRDQPSITPDTGHGEQGVFTGCMSPVTTTPGVLTSFYTSARRLPIHHTLPYHWGSEAICLMTSGDHGRTWHRPQGGLTVLPGPPTHLEVTGWRDPYVSSWPSLDKVTKSKSERSLCGIVAGGICDKGPAVFVYRFEAESLTSWEYISALTPVPMNFTPSRWTRDFGRNWEVVNFLSLKDHIDNVHDFLIVGAEGRKPPVKGQRSKELEHTDFRNDHAQMWMCGVLETTPSGEVAMHYRYGGVLDYGGLYAANSFHDPNSGDHVMFGWVVEEDLPSELREAQGWAGVISLPRVIKLQSLRQVVGALRSDLRSISCINLTPEKDGQGYCVNTLCTTPHPNLESLRLNGRQVTGSTTLLTNMPYFEFQDGCSHWEVDITFDVHDDMESLGFIISHSEDSTLQTVVSFRPGTETVSVDRSSSSTIPGVCLAAEQAPHTLFTFAEHEGQKLKQEHLCFRAFFDKSVLELFVNDRTAITTRIYTDTGICFGIKPFVNGANVAAEQLERCNVWEI